MKEEQQFQVIAMAPEADEQRILGVQQALERVFDLDIEPVAEAFHSGGICIQEQLTLSEARSAARSVAALGAEVFVVDAHNAVVPLDSPAPAEPTPRGSVASALGRRDIGETPVEGVPFSPSAELEFGDDPQIAAELSQADEQPADAQRSAEESAIPNLDDLVLDDLVGLDDKTEPGLGAVPKPPDKDKTEATAVVDEGAFAALDHGDDLAMDPEPHDSSSDIALDHRDDLAMDPEPHDSSSHIGLDSGPPGISLSANDSEVSVFEPDLSDDTPLELDDCPVDAVSAARARDDAPPEPDESLVDEEDETFSPATDKESLELDLTGTPLADTAPSSTPDAKAPTDNTAAQPTDAPPPRSTARPTGPSPAATPDDADDSGGADDVPSRTSGEQAEIKARAARLSARQAAARSSARLTQQKKPTVLLGGWFRRRARLRIVVGFVLALVLGGIPAGLQASAAHARQIQPLRQELSDAKAHGARLQKLATYRSPGELSELIATTRRNSMLTTFALWFACSGILALLWFRFF